MLALSFAESGFSAQRRHRGGARDVAGRELQEQYAADQLVRLLHREEPRAIRVAVERASDVDVLVLTEGGGFREEYHQVKGRVEGAARWSVDALRSEGVWREFAIIAAEFAERAPSGWDLHLVFVTDAELNKDLLSLRDFFQSPMVGAQSTDNVRQSRSKLRGQMLAALAGGYLSPAEEEGLRSRAGKRLPKFMADICEMLDQDSAWNEPATRRLDAPFPKNAGDMLRDLAEGWDDQEGVQLARAVEVAARHLNFVIRSLRFRSRLAVESVLGTAEGRPLSDALPKSRLEEAVILSLVTHLHLSTSVAERAYRAIRASVKHATLSGAEYTEDALRGLVGVPEPILRDPPPPAVSNSVARIQCIDEISGAIRSHGAVWITGAPRVGKTELMRQALVASGDQIAEPARAVWLVPTGAPDDVRRFWQQLAGAVAEHSDNREWLAAMRSDSEGALSVRYQVLAAAAERELVIVVDSADALRESDRPHALALLAAAWDAHVRVVVAARSSWGIGGHGPLAERNIPTVAVGGLNAREAVQFWGLLGKALTEDATGTLILLSHRIGGIPEVLQLAASKCGSTPTAEEITTMMESLPGGGAEEIVGAVAAQLFHRFAIESPMGRLLPRIAQLSHGVDEAQARAIAQVREDPIPWSPLTWAQLASSTLQAEGRGRYHLAPVYREIAKLEMRDDASLRRVVHRAAAGVLLADAIATSDGNTRVTIHWADVRDAVGDYVMAYAWDQAAFPAYLLVRAFFNDAEPELKGEKRRAIADDLWLMLVSFRIPEALAAGIRADLHATILCALYDLERMLHPGEPPNPRTVEAMREVACRTGPAGERARELIAQTLRE